MSRACLGKPTYKNVRLYLFAVKGDGGGVGTNLSQPSGSGLHQA
jgi:hypothetical protein